MEHLQSDLNEFVGLLNALEVEYVVVGGFAVAFHGHPRFTGDIDLLVRPTRENATKVLQVLDRFGFQNHGVGLSDLTVPDRIVQLGNPPNRIDILTSITGVGFEQAWESRSAGTLGGHEVDYLGIDALLANKLASGRENDIADVRKLRSIKSSDG